MIRQLVMASVLVAATVVGVAMGDHHEKAPGPATTQSSAPVNKFCAVMKEHDADPEVFVIHEGKKIAFCCKDCIDPFKEDPAKYLRELK
jgi:hypothetical protein